MTLFHSNVSQSLSPNSNDTIYGNFLKADMSPFVDPKFKFGDSFIDQCVTKPALDRFSFSFRTRSLRLFHFFLSDWLRQRCRKHSKNEDTCIQGNPLKQKSALCKLKRGTLCTSLWQPLVSCGPLAQTSMD